VDCVSAYSASYVYLNPFGGIVTFWKAQRSDILSLLGKLLIAVLLLAPIGCAFGQSSEEFSRVAQAKEAVSESSGPGKSSSPVLAAQLRDGYFYVLREGNWAKVYVAGVNIGPATPGHFATEPPASGTVYAEWLEQIGNLGANCVRVYTLLPAAFYRALLDYNQSHPTAPLYLFQEIWLKEPPENDLFDAAFTADFEKGIRTVVDALYGGVGVSAGNRTYSADVSPYVLGWLVGREIEPEVVVATSLRNPRARSFEGQYLRIADGNPAETWLARRCDYLVAYEVEKYNRQRPVAFVNWPPLDPLVHPTESPLEEERSVRQALGIQDDRDIVSLDEERISAQPDFKAGYFALYHLYPFYPEFIYLDPDYSQARDQRGPNFYWGYLEGLKKHFRKTPLLVGEYGMSTSIGVAHLNPAGWNHGGLEETQQGEVLARLTENIRDVGFPGGLVFEWIDEWWKHSWIGADFKKPAGRAPYWLNDMDPEESFGIMKFVPKSPLSYVTLASAASPAGAKPRRRGAPAVRSLQAAADYSALYLDLELDIPPGKEPDWKKFGYLVALNTCGYQCGTELLPLSDQSRAGFGANFLVRLEGPEDGRLLIARSYNPYHEEPGRRILPTEDGILPPYFRSALDPDGSFEEMVVTVNGARHSRRGALYPAETYNRSLLRYGVFDAASPQYSSVAQWYFDKATRRIRLRLSWGLLLILDPSRGLVFAGTDGQGKTFGLESNQIQTAVVAFTKRGRRKPPRPVQILAKSVAGKNISEGWSLPWPKWFRVDAQMTPKRSYRILTDLFRRFTGSPGVH
jgi:hypothetical protein